MKRTEETMHLDAMLERAMNLLHKALGSSIDANWKEDARNLQRHYMVLRSPPMSECEYVKRDGNECPFCQSTDFASDGDVEVVGNLASQTIRCNMCGNEWYDHYTLIGYSRA